MATNEEVEWLVQIPDKADVLSTRFKHAAEHMQYNKPNRESGFLVFSGPTLKKHPAPGGPMEVTGSFLVVRTAGGKDEIEQILREDPLARNGVWDLEKAAITPFKLFRPPPTQ